MVSKVTLDGITLWILQYMPETIRLNSLKFLETEVQNPKSGFEAVKCIPPLGSPRPCWS